MSGAQPQAAIDQHTAAHAQSISVFEQSTCHADKPEQCAHRGDRLEKRLAPHYTDYTRWREGCAAPDK